MLDQVEGEQHRLMPALAPQRMEVRRPVVAGDHDLAVDQERLRLEAAAASTIAGKRSAAFGMLTCLPYAEAISASTPIGPFNSFSNEDHWIDDPTCPGVVLIGDAAGHNDRNLGQGLSIALRDVRMIHEVLGEAEGGGAGSRLQALC